MSQNRRYVFMGIKKHWLYYFGPLYTDLKHDVRYGGSRDEPSHLYTVDATEHIYAEGDNIHFKGRDAKIVRIARDIEGGHYVVYTNYVTEAVDDEKSKQKAEAEKAAYERLKSEKPCEKESNEHKRQKIWSWT